jgi:hypothetical protein
VSNYDTLAADGSTDYIRCTGTVYQIEAEGTWGGGTLTPKKKSFDGTAITLGDTTLTADGAINVEVPYGAEICTTLSGSTSPSLKVHVIKIR